MKVLFMSLSFRWLKMQKDLRMNEMRRNDDTMKNKCRYQKKKYFVRLLTEILNCGRKEDVRLAYFVNR